MIYNILYNQILPFADSFSRPANGPMDTMCTRSMARRRSHEGRFNEILERILYNLSLSLSLCQIPLLAAL